MVLIFFPQTTSQQQQKVLATRRIFFNPFLIFTRFFFLLIKNIRIQGKEEKGPLTFPMEKKLILYQKRYYEGEVGG